MKNKIIMIVVTALVVVTCLVTVAWFSYDAGYTVGSLEAKNEKYETVEGVYRYDKWNGDDTVVLVLNKDGTCIRPTGATGTWRQEGDKIVMTFGDDVEYATIAGFGIGVIFCGAFFEKIN